MKILITGVAGFIGSNLAIKLLGSISNIEIIGIDSMNDYYDVSLKEYRLNEIEKMPSGDNFLFIKGNIADKQFMTDLFKRNDFDIVVNLAAQAGVRYSITNPDAYIESNIIGFYNILECCRKFPVKHLIYASSSSIYGDNTKVPFSEEDKTDSPVSLYAATKKSNELLAYSYSKLYKIPMTGLRFFTVYGPAGRPDMAYFSFTNKLIKGEPIQIFNYGNCKRDFTYIDDIVESISRLLNKPPQGDCLHEVYNIGSSNPQNLIDFINILEEELVKAEILPNKYDFNALHKMVAAQKGDVVETYADCDKLEKHIGFSPKTGLREGIQKFVKWFKEYYHNS